MSMSQPVRLIHSPPRVEFSEEITTPSNVSAKALPKVIPQFVLPWAG